jgi:hypothetical protein
LHELLTIVSNFPAGSAARPSGLRPQHLQDVLRGGSGLDASLLRSLDGFLQFCVKGRLPVAAAPFLCAANVIPLKKTRGRPCSQTHGGWGNLEAPCGEVCGEFGNFKTPDANHAPEPMWDCDAWGM